MNAQANPVATARRLRTVSGFESEDVVALKRLAKTKLLNADFLRSECDFLKVSGGFVMERRDIERLFLAPMRLALETGDAKSIKHFKRLASCLEKLHLERKQVVIYDKARIWLNHYFFPINSNDPRKRLPQTCVLTMAEIAVMMKQKAGIVIGDGTNKQLGRLCDELGILYRKAHRVGRRKGSKNLH